MGDVSSNPHAEKQVVIIGAGPAGLTAAYELAKARVRSVVIEKDRVVGGLSRTVNYKGYRFDVGGHQDFDTPARYRVSFSNE